MWKFEGNQLKNKAENVQTGWKETAGEGKNIFIEKDNPDGNVLSVDSNDGRVGVEPKSENSPKQLWVKGELTQDSFFTLKNVGSEKFLTCGSGDANFEVAGKIMFSINYNNFNRPL